jgi:predicted NBD/HSP70 family sugar kinase
MSKRAVIALDVGGTTIDTACVAADGELIGGLLESDSPAARTKDEIVNELARVIEEARARAGDARVTGCGIAMPGRIPYGA